MGIVVIFLWSYSPRRKRPVTLSKKCKRTRLPGRVNLSTCQATAAKYHQRMEHERKAREDAAKSIVMGLGDGLDSFDSDVLAGIADGIESVLRAPMGEGDSS